MSEATTDQPLSEEEIAEKREQLVTWYKDQIEVATLRHELTRLQSETVQFEAARLQAAGMIAQMQGNPQSKDDPDSESTPLDGEETKTE